MYCRGWGSGLRLAAPLSRQRRTKKEFFNTVLVVLLLPVQHIYSRVWMLVLYSYIQGLVSYITGVWGVGPGTMFKKLTVNYSIG